MSDRFVEKANECIKEYMIEELNELKEKFKYYDSPEAIAVANQLGAIASGIEKGQASIPDGFRLALIPEEWKTVAPTSLAEKKRG